ncbi:MAG: hypothetical protein KFH87_10230 [Bacteroidetes bacterium]|nr:hypothetical protein [Bacteroidota bacterium]
MKHIIVMLVLLPVVANLATAQYAADPHSPDAELRTSAIIVHPGTSASRIEGDLRPNMLPTAAPAASQQFDPPHTEAYHGEPLHGNALAPAYESDILAARPIRYWLGLGLGAYAYMHEGFFSPSCDCEFRDEDGVRFMMTGEFRVEYPKMGFAWSVMLSYFDASAEFSREDTRSSVIVGDNPDLDVEYRNSSDVRLEWVSIRPGVFWYIPRSSFFLRGGFEVGVPLTARYDHVERILTPGVEYYDGTTENILLGETDIPGGGRLRFALTASLGYDILLSPSVAITPRAGIIAPLTNVSSQDNWTVLTAHGLLMLNIRL